MKRINSLSDLFVEELADLLSAENQLSEALPKMAGASQSLGVKSSLEECLRMNNEHVSQLENIFSNIGQNPQRTVCKAMRGLIREGEEAIHKDVKSTTTDAFIIDIAQRIQKYEIDKYKTTREHAADLGHTKIVEVFTKILNEARAMNFHFSEIAQGMINVQAGGGFYIPEGRFGKSGFRKKSKNTDVSRFIGEGNPNTQEPPVKGEEKEDGAN
jgi:ferritin-like metal-binding protein YciE